MSSKGWLSSARWSLLLIVWLLGAELCVRLFFVTPSRVVKDDVLGWLYKQNCAFRLTVTDTGFASITSNEFGLLDAPLLSTDHRRRLLTLGDSYVEALQVPHRQRFVELVNAARPDLRLLNAGRSGMDPLSETLFAERLTQQIHPDGYIMLVNAGDEIDIGDDDVSIVHCGASPCGYTLRAPPRDPLTRIANAGEEHSALVTYLVQRYSFGIKVKLDELRSHFSHGDAQANLVSPNKARMDLLLRLAFGRLAAQKPLLIVYIPVQNYRQNRIVEVDPQSAEFSAHVRLAAQAVGARFVNAGPVLAESYRNSGQPPVGFHYNVVGQGHLNRWGHQVIAALIESNLDMFKPGDDGR